MLRSMASPSTIWILSDGKAGDVAQCVGVAEALHLPYEMRTVAPKPPYSWWLPYGPFPPKDRETHADSPIAPPYPDIALASGRRAAAYLKRVKKASGGKTFTVFLKDPRTGPGSADLIWVPEHDKLRGLNVLVTPTSPHKFSASRLAELKSEPFPEIDSPPAPKVAVLLGGDSRHHTFTESDQKRFIDGLRQMATDDQAHFLITVSRRTPADLAKAVEELAISGGHYFWAGDGPNPYGHFLAKADAFVATADSTNMIGEATSTGRPIHVFHPSGGHDKITRFLGTLEQLGCVHPFPGPMKTTTYEPIDATPVIAERILADYSALHHAGTPSSGEEHPAVTVETRKTD
ncbi:mitochondrial fission ELM1 family protein [Labrenzia sp. PHM005]|uniref:mitochondrial fission ELM1 family protein n=1 Tax=Labrenzia sp. PHM005 TaxID=2590016 RepID=UPI001AD92128|nr:mitochondrial fission ELM1 family protein [Labrenzia sp. PHM005]